MEGATYLAACRVVCHGNALSLFFLNSARRWNYDPRSKMPLLKRTSSDMFWWPVLTLKRGYNETDYIGRGGSQQGDDFVNKVKQDDSDDITSSVPAQTATTALAGYKDALAHSTSAPIVGTSTERVHISVAPPAPTSLTSNSGFLSLDANTSPTPGLDITTTITFVQPTSDESGIAALAAAVATMEPTSLSSPGIIPLSPPAPLLSSTLERTKTTPTNHPLDLPSTKNRDNGLSPEEITIIVAVVISFAVFLALLAIAIHCAILRRRRHEARERARRPAMARLPPALKKPSASSLRTTAAADGGGDCGNGEEENDFHDDDGDGNAEFRIVIRPPPGYRTPQSGAATPTDGHPPLGTQRSSTPTPNSPATVGRAVSSESGQHWSFDTENGSIISGTSQRVPVSRLNLTNRDK